MWILIWQQQLSKIFGLRIIASFFMFYIPLLSIGYILQRSYSYFFLTPGVLISLLWLAWAPFLIESAYYDVIYFLQKYQHKFKNKEQWQKIFQQQVQRIQSFHYWPFSVLWGLLVAGLIVYVSFIDAPFLIQLWAAVSFFLLFFVSSIGFYGVYVLITIMKNIFEADIIYNPFHPDRFGGIANFGKFSVKGSIYFSSGALVFPLVFELIANLGTIAGIPIYATFFFGGFFLITLFASFLIPILQIKSYVEPIKEKIILNSRQKLDGLMENFSNSEELDIKKGAEIYLHYQLVHKKLLEMKDYPWDIRVLLEFSLSFIIPLLVGSLQLIL